MLLVLLVCAHLSLFGGPAAEIHADSAPQWHSQQNLQQSLGQALAADSLPSSTTAALADASADFSPEVPELFNSVLAAADAQPATLARHSLACVQPPSALLKGPQRPPRLFSTCA